MLDHFAVFSKGGAVLWSHTDALPTGPSMNSLINSLIQNVLLRELAGETSYQCGNYILKWLFQNDLNLVFVAVSLPVGPLYMYMDELLTKSRDKFVRLYREDVRNGVCPPPAHFSGFRKSYDNIIDELMESKLSRKAAPGKPRAFGETKRGQKLGASGKAASPRKKKSQKDSAGDDDDDDDNDNDDDGEEEAPEPEAEAPKNSVPEAAVPVKEQVVSPKNSAAVPSVTVEDDPDTVAPADATSPSEKAPAAGLSLKGADKLAALKAAAGPRAKAAGPRAFTKKPSAEKPKKEPAPSSKSKPKRLDDSLSAEELAALDFSSKAPAEAKGPAESTEHVNVGAMKFDGESDDDDDEEDEGEEEPAAQKKGFFGFISSLVSGKQLTREDVGPILDQFRELLMKKNVAADISDKLCDSVSASLEGKTVGTFTTVKSTVKKALEEALTRILTPKRSIDVLQGVALAQQEKRPYVIVMVGVNGVGKSTSLAKLCAYFLHKNLKVMISACDTFRSGAVEQLRTHAVRLQVPLFERGYNKDAASVAMDAVKEAKSKGIDVVLVDTAGRMQGNEPLMRALSKLINMNKPDLTLFVGEALVGNDAVDQLTQFNKKLADLSETIPPRLIDGIVLTKFDTIDDKVGAAISMTYTTGQPIMFVGTGQDYQDLKKMNTKMLIKALLK